MTRYHFHTKDGRCVADEEGTELASYEAAKDMAVVILAEQLHRHPELLWHTGEFSIVVTDDKNLTLLTVDLSANESAAARPQRAPPRPLNLSEPDRPG